VPETARGTGVNSAVEDDGETYEHAEKNGLAYVLDEAKEA